MHDSPCSVVGRAARHHLERIVTTLSEHNGPGQPERVGVGVISVPADQRDTPGLPVLEIGGFRRMAGRGTGFPVGKGAHILETRTRLRWVPGNEIIRSRPRWLRAHAGLDDVRDRRGGGDPRHLSQDASCGPAKGPRTTPAEVAAGGWCWNWAGVRCGRSRSGGGRFRRSNAGAVTSAVQR